MPPFCCDINRSFGTGHRPTCPRNINAGKAFMNYPDGIGDIRFHYFDGRSFTLKRVQFDSVGGDKNGHIHDTTGEFENGEVFHVPNVAWWEVVYS